VLALIAPLAGLGFAAWSNEHGSECGNYHAALSFGIRAERVATLTNGCGITRGDLNEAMWIDVIAALLYGLGLAVLLLVFWRFGWRSRRQGCVETASKVVWLPLAAGLFDIIENVLVLAYADVENGAIRIGEIPAQLVATFGIGKWLLVIASVGATFLTLYGAIRFRALNVKDWDAAEPPDQEKIGGPDLAVCLSGGGIRSAAFSWGALSHLEKSKLLTNSTTIYSVSGGGYAANAWTSSAPELRPEKPELPTEEPGFFDITPTADRSAPPTTPFAHVRSTHRYLTSLRGGLGLASVKALLGVATNLLVVLSGVLVVAILPALLSRSSFGAVINEVVDRSADGTKVSAGALRDGAWRPVLWLAALAVPPFLVSLFLGRRPRHIAILLVFSALGLAAATMVVTLALPWLAHRLDRLLEDSWWATVPAVLTWVGGLALAYLRPRLSKVAIRLGGVLAAVGMFYVLVWVIRRLVVPGAWPALDWLPESSDPFSTWALVLLGAALFLIAIDHTGVQWWSLHPLYRDRLAGTFAMTRNENGGVETRPHTEWPRWSDLESSSSGPNHVICAATHRREPAVTGLRSISYRFEKRGVTFHEPVLDDSNVTTRSYHATAAWLDRSFGLPPGETPLLRRWWRLSRKPNARSTTVAAAAISGAAFNSAMGRQSKGTTDSLLAVLNLRLGVWMPNQRFTTHLDKSKHPRPFPRAGLRYLFHEVIGHFDIEDPFVHVSDGGHWENLGLAEALRDRPKRVMVFDASGGKVAPVNSGALGAHAEGFASLNEATDLARVELATEIQLDVAVMRPDPTTGRARQNWAVGKVRYHYDRIHNWETECKEECLEADLLFVKAVICDRTPEWVLAYANTDRVFPDYPTGDQFLTDDQFDALVRLGCSAAKDARADPLWVN